MRRDIPNHRIFLVGFMGSGKSTVARALADRRKAPCVDTDAWIEARAGRTIAEIFESFGEEWFRALEREALDEACRQPRAVVATGGGLFANAAHRECIRTSGSSVWLDAPLARLWERCRGQGGRPLLGGLEEALELYESRCAGYALADWRVETGDRSVEEVVDEVMRLAGPAPDAATD